MESRSVSTLDRSKSDRTRHEVSVSLRVQFSQGREIVHTYFLISHFNIVSLFFILESIM